MELAVANVALDEIAEGCDGGVGGRGRGLSGDQRPVGVLDSFRFVVHGRDRGLQRVRAQRAAELLVLHTLRLRGFVDADVVVVS